MAHSRFPLMTVLGAISTIVGLVIWNIYTQRAYDNTLIVLQQVKGTESVQDSFDATVSLILLCVTIIVPVLAGLVLLTAFSRFLMACCGCSCHGLLGFLARLLSLVLSLALLGLLALFGVQCCWLGVMWAVRRGLQYAQAKMDLLGGADTLSKELDAALTRLGLTRSQVDTGAVCPSFCVNLGSLSTVLSGQGGSCICNPDITLSMSDATSAAWQNLAVALAAVALMHLGATMALVSLASQLAHSQRDEQDKIRERERNDKLAYSHSLGEYGRRTAEPQAAAPAAALKRDSPPSDADAYALAVDTGRSSSRQLLQPDPSAPYVTTSSSPTRQHHSRQPVVRFSTGPHPGQDYHTSAV